MEWILVMEGRQCLSLGWQQLEQSSTLYQSKGTQEEGPAGLAEVPLGVLCVQSEAASIR